MSRWTGLLLCIAIGLVLGIFSGYRQYYHEEESFFQLVSGKTPTSVAKAPGAMPRIVVENGIDYNYGVMELGETKSHEFEIRNHTDKPLSLTIVDTTCKCTVGSLPGSAIPAGGMGRVKLEWTAKAYAPDFRQSATLRTSDEINQLIVLSVHGDVLEAVHAEPMSVIFSEVTFGTRRSQKISLVGYDSPELEVASMEWQDPSSAEHFECTWRPMQAEELEGSPKPVVGLMGTLVLKEEMPLGPFREELTLHLRSGKDRTIGIPVEGRITSDVSVVGNGYRESSGVLELGVVTRGTAGTRRLRMIVKGPHREGFQVLKVTAEPDGILEAKVGDRLRLASNSVSIFPIDVMVRADAKPISRIGIQGRLAGKILIQTTHPIAKEIPIEVRFAVVEE